MSWFHNALDINIPNVRYFSFDASDCEKYNFSHYNQYCSGYSILYQQYGEQKVCFDFYFLGLNKGRKEFLDSISRKISRYKLFLDIKERPTIFISLLNKIYKNNKYCYVNYSEHLNNLLNSNVVLDIVKNGQTGLTMRTIECLIAKKKLITNNPNVMFEPFFNSNNIMVINDSCDLSDENLNRFIATPFERVDVSILERYNPETVFTKIINNEN